MYLVRRVVTRLVSATLRRARGVSVRARAARLAWGVSSEQLGLLLRLLREHPPPPPHPHHTHANTHAPTHPSTGGGSSSSLDSGRVESWSSWAWSWLPAWERAGPEDMPAVPAPTPFAFTAYFDQVSFMFKVILLYSLDE
ncbi:unnamed protein product [Parnassius mnemosyne]|uniref:Uncharacterized protein n=1 Tax=Parnassius mnemosyne TaxID=213953 RepID=A0AAV1KYC1_9NEOP